MSGLSYLLISILYFTGKFLCLSISCWTRELIWFPASYTFFAGGDYFLITGFGISGCGIGGASGFGGSGFAFNGWAAAAFFLACSSSTFLSSSSHCLATTLSTMTSPSAALYFSVLCLFSIALFSSRIFCSIFSASAIPRFSSISSIWSFSSNLTFFSFFRESSFRIGISSYFLIWISSSF